MSVGERGPTGDHGQDGRAGVPGATGKPGERGKEGAQGTSGKDVLSKAQTLVGFVFVVTAFLLLAVRGEVNSSQIRDGVERQDMFLVEICRTQPALAPETCALPR